MAKKHFDEKGFPKLEEIIQEICGYVRGLEIEQFPHDFYGNVVNRRKIKHSSDLVAQDIRLFPGLPARDILLVKGIYVVGGQVAYLPDSYNKGDHDLDLVIRTNASSITDDFRDLDSGINYELNNILNNGKGCWTERNSKRFAIEIWDEEIEKLRPPYLQIFPKIEKVLE